MTSWIQGSGQRTCPRASIGRLGARGEGRNQMAKAAPNSGSSCANCGALLADGLRFCTSCGAAVRKAMPPPAAPVTPAPPVTPPPAATPPPTKAEPASIDKAASAKPAGTSDERTAVARRSTPRSDSLPPAPPKAAAAPPPPAVSPVAAASTPAPPPSNRTKQIVLVVAGVALIGLVAVVVALVTRGSSHTKTNATSVTTPTGVGAVQSSAPAPEESSAAPPDPTTTTTSTTVHRKPKYRPHLIIGVDLSSVGTGRTAENIALTMATYFGNIDRRRFALAHATEPSLGTTAALASGDGESRDSNVVVHTISGSTRHPVADVTFRSHQPASKGIDGESCTDWDNDYEFAQKDNGVPYVIVREPSSTHSAC